MDKELVHQCQAAKWTKGRFGSYTASIKGHEVRIDKLGRDDPDRCTGYRWVTHVDGVHDCGYAGTLKEAKRDVPHAIRIAAQRG